MLFFFQNIYLAASEGLISSVLLRYERAIQQSIYFESREHESKKKTNDTKSKITIEVKTSKLIFYSLKYYFYINLKGPLHLFATVVFIIYNC